MPLSYNGGSYSFEELQNKIMKEKGLSKERAGAYVATIEQKQKGAKLMQRFSKIIKMAEFKEEEHPRSDGEFTNKSFNSQSNLERLNTMRKNEKKPENIKVIDKLIEKEKSKTKLSKQEELFIQFASIKSTIEQGQNDDMVEDEQPPFISEGTGSEESSSQQITTKKSPGSED